MPPPEKPRRGAAQWCFEALSAPFVLYLWESQVKYLIKCCRIPLCCLEPEVLRLEGTVLIICSDQLQNSSWRISGGSDSGYTGDPQSGCGPAVLNTAQTDSTEDSPCPGELAGQGSRKVELEGTSRDHLIAPPACRMKYMIRQMGKG